jgi:hypothetical protein
MSAIEHRAEAEITRGGRKAVAESGPGEYVAGSDPDVEPMASESDVAGAMEASGAAPQAIKPRISFGKPEPGA